MRLQRLQPLLLALASRSPRTPPLRACGDWAFVDVKSALPELPPLVVDAVQSPFGAPLFIGSPRTMRIADGAALALLDRASRERLLVVNVPSTRLNFETVAGVTTTVARVMSLKPGRPGDDAASVTLVAVGRCNVLGIASGRGQAIQVRCRPLADAPVQGERAERAAKLAAAVGTLWSEVSAQHERVQRLQLEAKLKRLGGAGSAALLAIPLEQQLELRASAEAGGSADAAAAGAGGIQTARGLDAALASGVDLSERVKQVQQLAASTAPLLSGEDAAVFGAVATPRAPSAPRAAADAEAAAAAAAASAEASLLSLVALPLTNDGTAEADNDDGAQAAATDVVARLELVEARLTRKRAELAAAASLLDLGGSLGL